MINFGTTVIFEHIEYAIPLIFIAAFVRAYAGFGFAAISIVGLNIIWPPYISVPVILLIDLICGISLIPGAYKQVDKQTLINLFSGALLGAPLGICFLLYIPELWFKISISLFVLALCVRMALLRKKAEKPLTARNNKLIGGASAAITAAASVGGPPLVIYLLGSNLRPEKQRALLIVFLAATSLLSIAMMLLTGIATSEIVIPALLLLLPAFAGIYLGHRFFNYSQPKSFRPIAIPILTVMAISSLAINFNQI